MHKDVGNLEIKNKAGLIVVRTPDHPWFYYTETKNLFEKHHSKLDVDDYETVLKTTHFFDFILKEKGELIGFIYFYQMEDKVYVTACAERGHHELNMDCLKKSLEWYTCDIYAECKEKPAIYCLLKCGFKKVDKNLYVYRRNK